MTSLPDPPADVIRYLMIGLGLGTLPTSNGNWPISVAKELDNPDNAITVYDTTGSDDGRSMIDGELFGHSGIQIRLRSRTYTAGYAKMDAIQTELAQNVSQRTVSVGSNLYTVWSCSRIGDIIPLGTDEGSSKRYLFTMNLFCSLKKVN